VKKRKETKQRGEEKNRVVKNEVEWNGEEKGGVVGREEKGGEEMSGVR
jgi:hypothetical protein